MGTINNIPLAKGFNEDKMDLPAYVSEKLDGVPIKFTVGTDGKIAMSTRSGKGSTISCTLIEMELRKYMPKVIEEELIFIGEVTHRTDKSFKDVSGHVRRMTVNSDLVLNLFDFCKKGSEHVGFGSRNKEMIKLLGDLLFSSIRINIIPQVMCNTFNEVLNIVGKIPKGQEGWVVRSWKEGYFENKRCWGYQKVVAVPLLDLEVIKFDEAVSKEGVPLNMVGKLWIQYNHQVVGCGPGKLTHDERKRLWALTKANNGYLARSNMPEPKCKIAAIKHKVDDSYTALREATFVVWRFDKEEPNET
jgi:ATP-dependent DNA ligase